MKEKRREKHREDEKSNQKSFMLDLSAEKSIERLKQKTARNNEASIEQFRNYEKYLINARMNENKKKLRNNK